MEKEFEFALFMMEGSTKLKKMVEGRKGKFTPDEIEMLKKYGELFVDVANNAEFINMLTSTIEEIDKMGV